jgi:anti-sigma regulatory factor (Ser/Thr protein kinase)
VEEVTIAIPVADQSYVAAARREVEATARQIGLQPEEIARAALVATELATNLARHGRGGHLLLRRLPSDPVTGVELVAVDRGPGIADVAASLRDGISSRGTSGTGLGAIQRQSDEFDIVSGIGQGTAVLARIWPRRKIPTEVGVRVGVVSTAMPGEAICGDSWGVLPGNGKCLGMVADGLGHGALAAQASHEARRLFVKGETGRSATAIVQTLHAGLRATRGAAVGVVSLDLAANRAVFSGVGNIAGLVTAGGNTRRFVSMNGIAGHAAERIQEFIYPCEGAGLVLVMHSDGLSANWSLDRYPGLSSRDPALIAAVLHRDAKRGRDDATVLVLKRIS